MVGAISKSNQPLNGEEQLPALEIIKDWQLSAKDLFRWLYVE